MCSVSLSKPHRSHLSKHINSFPTHSSSSQFSFLGSSSYITIPFHLQHITHQNSLLIFLSPSSTTTILSRMRSSSSLKQEFLKKWIWCLRKYSSQKKNMNLLERKKAIKLSADLAMASTRNETTRWSRAIIANASRDDDSSPQQQHQLQRERKTVMNSSSPLGNNRRIIRKVLRRKRRILQKGKERVVASFIAKRIVQKRTRRLKSLLPGGESMDDVSLVEETLDYIQSLRAQVEVMRCLVTASELLINPS